MATDCDMGTCDAGSPNWTITSCVECGAEMQFDGGFWWHHTQMDLPLKQRISPQYGAPPKELIQPKHRLMTTPLYLFKYSIK